jgi:hypothetical protein
VVLAQDAFHQHDSRVALSEGGWAKNGIRRGFSTGLTCVALLFLKI